MKKMQCDSSKSLQFHGIDVKNNEADKNRKLKRMAIRMIN
jgi:hypothetical protein